PQMPPGVARGASPPAPPGGSSLPGVPSPPAGRGAAPPGIPAVPPRPPGAPAPPRAAPRPPAASPAAPQRPTIAETMAAIRDEKWPERLAALDKELHEETDPSRRAVLEYEVGHLLEVGVDDEGQAAPAYGRA